MTDRPPKALDARLATTLRAEGYVFAEAAEMRAALERHGPLADWDAFARSWDDLAVDAYMADRGRYRRRRHAAYRGCPDGSFAREAHRPHYQSLDYNPLHGGIERWFEPIRPEIGEGPSMRTILGFCLTFFGPLASDVSRWDIEAHQFRIEARPGEAGQPTPEGLHRDGVDFVLVLLVRRRNIVSGTTSIHALDRRLLGSFTLAQPFDAALVDDKRVYHGVTPVEPEDPAASAYRDVLVVTLRAARAPPPA